jgi:formate dehydrogenase subunit gamma
MATVFAHIRFIAGALALAFMLAMAPAPATAQVNPTADAVKEQQLLQQLKGGVVSGRVSIPDQKAANLIHPAGREWRHFHEVTLIWLGAIVILGMVALLAIFYLWRGTVPIEAGRSGRKLIRFTGLERFVHWLVATCFILLGITGLNVTFGKRLLLPLLGPDAFSTWSEYAKFVHNYLSFGFTIGVMLMFLMWISVNFPNRTDAEWLKRGGGIVGSDHPPARKFNAGQKILYWLVMFAAAAMIVSGYALMFPFYGGLTIANMELASVFHGVVAMLFVALIIAHIYLGTLGMEGAFEAMAEGTVDLNWAKQHHSLWVKEEEARAKGERPSSAVARPAR